MPVPDNLIDVDFGFDGWIESDEDATYGEPFPDKLLIPRSEWRDRIEERKRAGHELKHFFPKPFNQNPESSCVYNAGCGCLMTVRNFNLGLEHEVRLSPMAGYCRVAKHRHSGSTMWGCLEVLKEDGVLPSDKNEKYQFDHVLHENTPFILPRSLPSGWQETAKLFRVTEWLRIDSREQFGSALLQDMPICYGRSGHSIKGEDMVYENGKFLCRYCDSYGLGRGTDGRLFDSEKMWATGGAWACRTVTLPDDPNAPGR